MDCSRREPLDRGRERPPKRSGGLPGDHTAPAYSARLVGNDRGSPDRANASAAGSRLRTVNLPSCGHQLSTRARPSRHPLGGAESLRRMRSGSGPRRNGYPHLHTGADDKSRGAAYLLAMDALVQIDDVTKRYDGSARPAVDGMNLEIAPGDAIAVMGPSSSGKPALPNLIADLDRPTNGTITAAGRRTRPSSPKRSASEVSLRARRDRLILDAYSVAARREQIVRAISTEAVDVVVWRDRDRRSDRRNGGITATRRCYRQPRITGRRPDLKQRVQAMRRRRRLPSEAQQARVIHADRRTGGD